jgi:peptide subunit release factor 1 (eRF1)
MRSDLIVDTLIAPLEHRFGERPTLSVYLPIRPELNAPQGYRAELLTLLRDARARVPEASLDAFEAISGRAVEYVRNDYTPSGRTLGLFAAQPDLLHIEEFAIPMPAIARFQAGAFVAPLAAAIENNPTVVIVCVGLREDRFVVARLHEIEASGHESSDVPGRQRQGGWSAFRYERDRARHVNEHVKDVASRAAQLCRDRAAKWLVLGGVAEQTNVLSDALPAPIQKLIAGRFALEMFDSDSELLEIGLKLAAEAETREEVELALEIKDRALALGNACLGWDQTRERLAEGRVHVLAMPVGAIGSDEGGLALNLAWDTGGRVEFIGPQAQEILQSYGGIGALLRY